MLKHLTLSSGWMQKQQWMLHLYWLEVIRRYFFSFLSLPHPQTVQSWESAPVFRLRSANAHRAGRSVGREPSSPFYLLSDIQISGEMSATLIFKTMRGEIVQIHLRERKERAEWVIWGRSEERRESAFWGNRRRSSGSRRHPWPAPFPATSWRTSPSPKPLELLQLVLSLRLRFHHHNLSPPPPR